MKKKAKKVITRGILKRYLAMLLAVITVITTIPLSNLTNAYAGTKDRTFYFTLDDGGSDSYVDNYWVFWDSDLTAIANAEKYGSVCQSAYLLIATWETAKDNYKEAGDITWSEADGKWCADGDFYNCTPFLSITIIKPDGYHLASVLDADDSKMAYYYNGDDKVIAECGLYVGNWTDVGSGESRDDESTSNITLVWEKDEPDTSNMTISWDSGVDYVGANGYDSDYDFTFSGQDHDFPYDSTLQTNVHLKDGFEMHGFQEGDTLWTDWWTNDSYPGIVFGSWSMDGNRSVRVLTKTTLSFSYDNGFTNSSHTETVNTDSVYKDYPKFKENYELDYVEDLDTGDKWYSYDGRDSKGSYMSWTAYKPRRIKYHSKLIEGAKMTLNLDQNGATTKGTERVDVYHNMKISDVTIPKKEYTATFFDGNKKVHDDIISKFKFLGYWNDEEGLVHTNITSKFRDYYRPGSIGSTSTTVTGGATYDGTSTYPVTESGNKVTTTVYAGNGDYSSANFRLDCYGFKGYVMVSYNGGSDSGESWYVEASTEDESGKEIYSGYDFSADGYGYIYVNDWIEIFVSGDNNDWWTDISVMSVDMTTLKKGYWYDENGKGLINYPLYRNHTIKAMWSGDDITLPEAPAKEGYEFVGWRTEDAKLMTADYKKSDDDEDYNDCMNKFNGDVAAWYRASRNAENNVSDIMVGRYLVPGSYYINDEVLHFQYYYIDLAGDDVGLSKDTRFIACFDEIPKVTLRTSAGKGISKTSIDGTECTSGREVYQNTTHTISADVKKGYKFDAWYSGGKVYSTIQNTRVTVGNTDLSLVAKANANNYKITYNLNGGTHGVLHPDSAEYDSTVTISNPTKTGYTFTGWTITGFDREASGHKADTWTEETRTDYRNLTATDGATVTFTATWSKEAPKTAGYIVKHYKMDANGNYSSVPDETENLTADIGSSVTPNTKDYGKLYNKPSLKTITVSSDSSQNIIEYRYSRKMARVILYKDEGIESTDPITGSDEKDYVGATIKLLAVMLIIWMAVVMEHFTQQVQGIMKM